MMNKKTDKPDPATEKHGRRWASRVEIRLYFSVMAESIINICEQKDLGIEINLLKNYISSFEDEVIKLIDVDKS